MRYTNQYRHAKLNPTVVGFFETKEWEEVQDALDWLALHIADTMVMGSQQIIVLHDDAVCLAIFECNETIDQSALKRKFFAGDQDTAIRMMENMGLD